MKPLLNRLLTAACVAGIAASGMLFGQLALGNNLLAPDTCSGELWNGTIQTTPCPSVSSCSDCGFAKCEDHRGVACYKEEMTLTCIRVCNAAGQVTGIDCVCLCSTNPGPLTEPNCPPA